MSKPVVIISNESSHAAIKERLIEMGVADVQVMTRPPGSQDEPFEIAPHPTLLPDIDELMRELDAHRVMATEPRNRAERRARRRRPTKA